MRVIPNGVDVTLFRPNQVAHMTLRRQLRISRSAPVVVFAARYDEMKNVGLFVNAARIFLNEHPEGHVLMCGAGMDAANEALAKQLLPLPKRVHLLGVQKKMENIYPAADIVALTSAFGEAAPLCLIEGMMCGAVPVATAVGDCEAIVDGRGLITTFVPEDVATAWSYAIAHRKYFLPELLASRAQFDRARMIAAYGELIQELAPVAL
jgi:glycosyltransferase involved in cell wall biosynthesis